MKTTLNAKSARNAVKFVSAVTRGSYLPILGELHCYSSGHFEVTGTDLDNTLIARIDSRTAIEGKSLVNSRALVDACAGNNDFEIEAGEKEITFRNGSAARTLPRFEISDFPPLPNIPDTAQCFTVNCAEFRRALTSIAMAQSKDASRYILQGVCLEFSVSGCKLISTDGRRLHMADIGAVGNAELVSANEAAIAHAAALVTSAQGEKQTDAANLQLAQAKRNSLILIHSETVKHLLKMPVGKNDTAPMIISRWEETFMDNSQKPAREDSRQMVRIDCGAYSIHARQIEGTYPAWRQVISGEANCGAWLKVEAFRACLKQAATACTSRANSVRLDFGMDKLTVSAGSEETGKSSAVMGIYYATAPDPLTFNRVSIAFNPDYLLDICDASKDCDEIRMDLINELSPWTFHTPNARQMVVMPMRLS